MAEELLNGRRPLDWELAAIEHGHQCDRDRDLESLAGVLAAGWPPERAARPLTDVVTGML